MASSADGSYPEDRGDFTKFSEALPEENRRPSENFTAAPDRSLQKIRFSGRRRPSNADRWRDAWVAPVTLS